MAYDPAYHAAYYQRNKDKVRRRDLARIGWTPELYEQCRREQRACCAICGRPEEDSRDGKLQCDHDHSNGKARALLCSQCNTALGLLSDDLDRLAAAARYLREWAV